MSNETSQDDYDELQEDNLIRYTQGVRLGWIKDQVGNKRLDNADAKDAALFFGVLADMDRTALNNKKIGVQEKQTANDQLVASTLARLSQSLGATNPFQAEPGTTVTRNVYDHEAEALPEIETVPGETSTGISDTSYDTFISRQEELEGAPRRRDEEGDD